MVDLKACCDYFAQMAEHEDESGVMIPGRIPGLKGFVVDTVDDEAGKKYQGLKKDQLPVLSMIMPSSQSTSSDVDALTEKNTLVLIILDKFDPQRKNNAVQVCIDTQPIIEALKEAMINDKAAGCHFLSRLDLESLSTMPETGVYGNLAGWSLGLSFESVGFGFGRGKKFAFTFSNEFE